MPEVCRSCKAPIRWTVHARTKNRMPLDAEPDRERGNVLLIETDRDEAIYKADVGTAIVLAGEALTRVRSGERDLYLSHFATCPFAASHRGGANG